MGSKSRIAERLSKAVKEKLGCGHCGRRLTLREAAQYCGVSASTLLRIERGQMPDLLTFALVCDWLGKDPKEILYGK